jgi:hypothetical protein
MPLFMDHHKGVEGLTAEAVAEAHRKDMKIQDQYVATYHRYWSNEETGEVLGLAEAPNKERPRPSTARRTVWSRTR